MNDHANSILSTLNAQHGIKNKDAKIQKIEVKGYFTSCKGKSYFIKFEKNCNSSEEYKIEHIKHAKKCINYGL